MRHTYTRRQPPQKLTCAGEELTRSELAVVAAEIDVKAFAPDGQRRDVDGRSALAGMSRASYFRNKRRPHVQRALQRLHDAQVVGQAVELFDVLLEVARRTSGLSDISSSERRQFYATLAQLLSSAVADVRLHEQALGSVRASTPVAPSRRVPSGEGEAVAHELMPIFTLRQLPRDRGAKRARPASQQSDAELIATVDQLGLTLPRAVRQRLGVTPG